MTARVRIWAVGMVLLALCLLWPAWAPHVGRAGGAETPAPNFGSAPGMPPLPGLTGPPLLSLSVWAEVIDAQGVKKRVLLARGGDRIKLTVPSGARIPVTLSTSGSVPPFQRRWAYTWQVDGECEGEGAEVKCRLVHQGGASETRSVSVTATEASATAMSTPPVASGTRVFAQLSVTLVADGKTRARCPGRVGTDCWGLPSNPDIELAEGTAPSKLRLRIRGQESPGSIAHDACCDGLKQGYQSGFLCLIPPKPANLDPLSPCAGEWVKAADEQVTGNHHTRVWEYSIGIEGASIGAGLPAVTEAPSSGGGTNTVFVVDVSGSMNERWGERTRLQAAQAAVLQLLDLLAMEDGSGSRHRAGLVAFSNSVSRRAGLAADLEGLVGQVNGLRPGGNTDIGAGLVAALAILKAAAGEKLMILLSDGQSNSGLSRAQILDGPAKDAARDGVKIYTVGIGAPSELDEELLRGIARATGGAYYHAADAEQLGRIYRRARHRALGELLLEKTGTVRQGETTSPQTVQVPPDAAEFHVTLSWPGSDLEIILVDPKGTRVGEQYPGVSEQQRGAQRHVVMRNPFAGIWTISVFGKDVPKETTTYQLLASVRQPPAVVAGIGGGPPRRSDTAAVKAIIALEGLSVVLVVLLVGALYRRKRYRRS